MVKIKGLEVLQKYEMFRLTDLWIASGKAKSKKYHPDSFFKSKEGKELLEIMPDCKVTKKGRYGGVYGTKVAALAYSEWVSKELYLEFSKQIAAKPAPLRSKTTTKSFEKPLVPVTELCEKHAEKFYWDVKTPQQMNLILAALGYQKEGRPFFGAHGKTIKQWELTKAGKQFGAEFKTLAGQTYVRWSVDILDKIK